MDNRLERQRLVGHREIEPDTIIINGVEYRKVVSDEREPTLINIIKFWECNSITLRDENRNYDLYNQDIERLVRMIEEWLPPEKDLNIYKDQTLYANDAGWNNYRKHLIRKFR